MTSQTAAQLSASLHRQAFYIKMLIAEQKFFLKQKLPSGQKTVLKRLADTNDRGITDLINTLPLSGQVLKQTIDTSEDKIAALANIIERLSALPTEDVLNLEDRFTELIKVSYE